MRQLTYAERMSLLDGLERHGSEHLDHEEVMRKASESVSMIQDECGLAQGLARDVATLCDILGNPGLGEEQQRQVMGCLGLIAGHDVQRREQQGRKDPLGLCYLAGLVVHEARTSLGMSDSYWPYQLPDAAKKKAEDLLLQFSQEPLHGDIELAVRGREFLDRNRHLSGPGFLGRFHRNIASLAEILAEGKDREAMAWARGALSYLLQKEDVIDDGLGIAGLVDDAFVAGCAMDLVSGPGEPWPLLLDKLMEAWPFMSRLVFHAEAGGRPVSDYVAVNAALCCMSLRGPVPASPACVIAPSIGELPFLIAFIKALGNIAETIDRKDDRFIPEPGMEVVVDNRYRARFGGFKEENGQRFFSLETKVGKKTVRQTLSWLPASDLQRLTPTVSDGRLSSRLPRHAKDGEGTIGALEYLFGMRNPVPIRTDIPVVLLVSPTGRTRRISKELQVCGWSLEKVVGMGYPDAGERYGTSSGTEASNCRILVVPDAGEAIGVMESCGPAAWSVVMRLDSAASRNPEALERMARKTRADGSPMLLVTSWGCSEGIEEGTRLGSAVWEWRQRDLAALAWRHHGTGDLPEAISGTDRYACLSAGNSIHAVTIPSPEIDSAFDTKRSIDGLIRERGEDRSIDHVTMIDAANAGFFSLLRILEWNAEQGGPVSRLQSSIDSLRSISGFGSRLALEERHAAEAHACSLEEAARFVEREQPRLHVLRREIDKYRGQVQVVVGTPDVTGHVAVALGLDPVRVISWSDMRDDISDEPLLIQGWIGKHRMQALLRPPAGNPTVPVLYGVEDGWLKALQAAIEAGRMERASGTQRSSVFPGIPGWSRAEEKRELPASDPEYGAVLSQLAWDEIQGKRDEALRGISSCGTTNACQARFIMFSGGGHAFITREKWIAVLEHGHGRRTGNKDWKPSVIEKKAADLLPGDLIVISRGIGTDVIRNRADSLLETGTRDTSLLWRKALLEYAKKTGCSAETIAAGLNGLGLVRSPQTVDNWLQDEGMIAPNSRGALDAILELTRDRDLAQSLKECKAAISRVRGAHLRAARGIARLAARRFGEIVEEGGQTPAAMELGEGMVLVMVDVVDKAECTVQRSDANRLMNEPA